jgi:hypothetical protein
MRTLEGLKMRATQKLYSIFNCCFDVKNQSVHIECNHCYIILKHCASVLNQMPKKLRKYRNVLVIVLSVLLLVPCSTKRTLKQWLHIETSNQTPNNGNQRILCGSYCARYENVQTAKKQTKQTPSFNHLNITGLRTQPLKLLGRNENHRKPSITPPLYLLHRRWNI